MPDVLRPVLRRPMRPVLGRPITPIKGVGGSIITSIFADGTDGFYFDFSKTDRLFQDLANTPADGAGENIYLGLESHAWGGKTLAGLLASQAALLNDDFSSYANTAAMLAGGWVDASVGSAVLSWDSGNGGRAALPRIDGANIAQIRRVLSTVAGRTYKVTVVGAAAGISYRFGTSVGGTQLLAASLISDTTAVVYITATTTTTHFQATASGNGTTPYLDSLRLDSVPGNHGIQANTAAQPKWQTGGLARLDGSDDNWLTTLMPGLAMTAILKVNASAIDDTFLGAQADSSTRFSIGTDGSGRLGGRVGTQTFTTIFGGNDIRSTVGVAAITLDGSTVKLYWNGVEIYSGAQAGVPTTAIAIALGTYNNNGVLTTFLAGDIYHALAIKKALTAGEIAAITNLWGTS